MLLVDLILLNNIFCLFNWFVSFSNLLDDYGENVKDISGLSIISYFYYGDSKGDIFFNLAF